MADLDDATVCVFYMNKFPKPKCPEDTVTKKLKICPLLDESTFSTLT